LPPEAGDDGFWPRRLPATERLLARARRLERTARHLDEQLAELFLLPLDELPAGALGWLGEGKDPGQSYWLRADPVQLVADRDKLLLFGAETLALTLDEACALAEVCNQFLDQDGLKLHVAAPDRWYLQAEEPIRLRTVPLAAVAGRYLQEFLPGGEDAARWLGLSTELQMLLHQAPPNAAREAAGLPRVNGLWFWGAGTLPAEAAGGWRLVAADDPVVRGLAQLSGAMWQPLPASFGPQAMPCLIVDTRLLQALRRGDLERWRNELIGLEERLFAPLLQCLRRRELARLIIDTEGLRLTLDRKDVSRFWRRPQPIQHYLEF